MKRVDIGVRNARAQAAVLRTLANEVRRGHGRDETEGLRAQAIEESARLISATEGLVQPGPRAQPSDPPSDAARQDPPFRILVVEDDDAARLAIARGLAPDYAVVVASDGVEGLETASRLPFDAIVADIAMPGLDGISMVQRIRDGEKGPAIPVVFLTGETAPERIAAGFFAGGTSYLPKPVDLELLDEELRRVLTPRAE